MKQRLDLSDEEINSYMDFDSLRRKQKELDIKKRNRYTILKWSVPAILLVSSVIWFIFNNHDAEPPTSNQQLEIQSGQPTLPSAESIVLKDSVQLNNDIDNPIVAEQITKPKRTEVQSLIETSNTKQNNPVESVYTQAEPVNGYASLYAFLNANLQYPTESLKDSIQGVQTVSFVINKEGKPENIQFIESLGAPFEIESKRLIESMPVWKPATLSGKPVPSKLVLPLTFQIKTIKAKE
ncbi:MAG: energy transducer TonB [Chryseolinea sp.]